MKCQMSINRLACLSVQQTFASNVKCLQIDLRASLFNRSLSQLSNVYKSTCMLLCSTGVYLNCQMSTNRLACLSVQQEFVSIVKCLQIDLHASLFNRSLSQLSNVYKSTCMPLCSARVRLNWQMSINQLACLYLAAVHLNYQMSTNDFLFV